MELLAARMKELRNEKRLRQEEVAELMNVSLSAYQRYERNEREPMAPFLQAFALYFGVSMDYLFGLKDEREI